LQGGTPGHLMVNTYWLYRLAGHSACLDKQRRAETRGADAHGRKDEGQKTHQV